MCGCGVTSNKPRKLGYMQGRRIEIRTPGKSGPSIVLGSPLAIKLMGSGREFGPKP